MPRDRQTPMTGRIRIAFYYTTIFFVSASMIWRTQLDATARIALIGFGLAVVMLIDGTTLYLYIQSKRRSAVAPPSAGVSGFADRNQGGQPASNCR